MATLRPGANMGGPTVATHIASGKRRRGRARRRRRREERRREAEGNPLQPDTPTAGVATGEETYRGTGDEKRNAN